MPILGQFFSNQVFDSFLGSLLSLIGGFIAGKPFNGILLDRLLMQGSQRHQSLVLLVGHLDGVRRLMIGSASFCKPTLAQDRDGTQIIWRALCLDACDVTATWPGFKATQHMRACRMIALTLSRIRISPETT